MNFDELLKKLEAMEGGADLAKQLKSAYDKALEAKSSEGDKAVEKLKREKNAAEKKASKLAEENSDLKEELKESSKKKTGDDKDAERYAALEKRIAETEAQNSKLIAERESARMDRALDRAFGIDGTDKASDRKRRQARREFFEKVGDDLDGIEVDADGNIKGADDIIDEIEEECPWLFGSVASADDDDEGDEQDDGETKPRRSRGARRTRADKSTGRKKKERDSAKIEADWEATWRAKGLGATKPKAATT